MSKPDGNEQSAADAQLKLLQAELAQTNREVLALTLEMDERVEARTSELQATQEKLEQTNAELRALTQQLEQRVMERTEALRQSEARYREAADVLKEEARHKDEFLALLGHELRNPLASISNALFVLKRIGAPDPMAERMRGTISRQLHHLTRLIDVLLDVSRITSGKIVLRTERLDLAQLVRQVVEDARVAIEGRGLTLGYRAANPPLWVDGDRDRLAQIAGNILQNAAKFTDPGGHITVTTAGDESGVQLTVRDTGIGIDPARVDDLFEPFHQLEAGQSRSGGLGLGLALVKGLVEMHKGTVKGSSEGANQGSTFTVTLPWAASVTTPSHRSRPPGPIVPPRRILIIEDNADAAETLGVILELNGHSVFTAADARSGIEKALEVRPDVILSDINMPGEWDGYELARRIRATPALEGIQLIAVSGFGQKEDKRRAIDAGFDAHLTKPPDPEQLEELLRKRR